MGEKMICILYRLKTSTWNTFQMEYTHLRDLINEILFLLKIFFQISGSNVTVSWFSRIQVETVGIVASGNHACLQQHRRQVALRQSGSSRNI